MLRWGMSMVAEARTSLWRKVSQAPTWFPNWNFCGASAVRDAEGPSETSECWDLLVSFLPDKWADLAGETGALNGLRKDRSLCTLLMHPACGHSLREIVVRAGKADLADWSDVALLKRPTRLKAWLHPPCAELS